MSDALEMGEPVLPEAEAKSGMEDALTMARLSWPVAKCWISKSERSL